MTTDSFAVGGEPQPVVPFGEGSRVELDDGVEGRRVVGRVDRCRGLVGCGGQRPQVDLYVFRVELVAVVDTGNSFGTDGFGEGLPQFGQRGVETATGVLGSGFRPQVGHELVARGAI